MLRLHAVDKCLKLQIISIITNYTAQKSHKNITFYTFFLVIVKVLKNFKMGKNVCFEDPTFTHLQNFTK